jgi:hypothetical protein
MTEHLKEHEKKNEKKKEKKRKLQSTILATTYLPGAKAQPTETQHDHKGKERVLWFPRLCGFISHDVTCRASSGRTKGKEISRIIKSPQNGHSLAMASSSCDRSCTSIGHELVSLDNFSEATFLFVFECLQ